MMHETARHDTDEPTPVVEPLSPQGRHDASRSDDARWGFWLPGHSGIGVVLVHDLGTTPAGLKDVAEAVHEAGITVSVPLLPGHEDFDRPRNLEGLSPPELLAAVDEAVSQLARDHAHLLVTGFGLGGSLALGVAEQMRREQAAGRGRLDAIALVSTPAGVHGRRRWLAWLGRVALGSTPGPAPDCKKPDGDEIRLDAWPGSVAGLSSDVERIGLVAARSLDIPAIVFHSREDHLAPSRDARRLVRTLGSDASELVWMERSFHQIWLDYDARLVGERIARFAQAVGYSSPTESEEPAVVQS